MKKAKTVILLPGMILTFFFSGSAVLQASTHLHPPFSCSADCVPLSLFVREERLPKGQTLLLPELQEGDILLTDCAHTLGWRHGHAALVVDGPKQQVLEAVTLGVPSCIRSTFHWQRYPKVTILRLKDADRISRQKIACWAEEKMTGLPYHLSSGLLGEKFPSQPEGSQCAYLIWYTYRHFGYDLDSDGGTLVTVDDLLHSPFLETVAALTGSP